MYDFAHPIQDAIEGITHSLCSLEYEAHRPLYNWVVEQCEFEHKPRQIEFARLNLTDTIMSKRYLRALVEGGYVDGWDDPADAHAVRHAPPRLYAGGDQGLPVPRRGGQGGFCESTRACWNTACART